MGAVFDGGYQEFRAINVPNLWFEGVSVRADVSTVGKNPRSLDGVKAIRGLIVTMVRMQNGASDGAAVRRTCEW